MQYIVYTAICGRKGEKKRSMSSKYFMGNCKSGSSNDAKSHKLHSHDSQTGSEVEGCL